MQFLREILQLRPILYTHYLVTSSVKAIDGVLGPNTLEVLDQYISVIRLPEAPNPAVVDGDASQGESKYISSLSPNSLVARIYFPTDGSRLDADDTSKLLGLAIHLAAAHDFSIEFRGFADKRETFGHNLALASLRADAVYLELVNLLEDSGVPDDAAQYDVIPLGELERPQAGETAEELKPFRRVDVWLKDVSWSDKICPPRSPDEKTDSADEALVLMEGSSAAPDRYFVSLIGFTVDDDSLGKLSSEDYTRLEKITDPNVMVPKRKGTKAMCWVPDEIIAFGFRDCHESPFLSDKRALSIAREFPTSYIRIGTYQPGPNDTEANRRKNRAVAIVVTFRVEKEVDFSGGGLDALLNLFKENRETLEGKYRKENILLAELLAKEANDEVLTIGAGKAESVKSGVLEWEKCNIDWKSGRKLVGNGLVFPPGSIDQACYLGIGLDELMMAINQRLFWEMVGGTNALNSGPQSISGGPLVCSCWALKELARRTKKSNDIYYALKDFKFEGDWLNGDKSFDDLADCRGKTG